MTDIQQVAAITYEGKKRIIQVLEMIASSQIVDKYNIDTVMDIIKAERLDAATKQMDIDSDFWIKSLVNKTT